MNIPWPEHLDAQYIFREYGGYIFKLPKTKDMCYQSLELQEYYYWTLAELAYKQLVVGSKPNMAHVANWTAPVEPGSNSIKSRYIQLTEIKKPQRDRLIATALAQTLTTANTANTAITNNSFQYIESVS